MSDQKPPSITPPGGAARRVTAATSGSQAPSRGVTFSPVGPIGDVDAPDRPAPTPDPGPSPAKAEPAPRPSVRAAVSAPEDDGAPRRVRLAIARVDPWSVLKLSFLLAVAAGIMLVVTAAVVWQTLDGLSVFTKVNDMVVALGGSNKYAILDAVSFKRTISLATIIGVVDIVLLTALATLGSFLYNIVAALVGGLHLTLTDD